MKAYVGSITGDPKLGESSSAISVLDLNEGSGALTHIQSLPGLESPTYLALHPSLPVLYAGEREWPPMGPQATGRGAITSLAIGADGKLALLASQPSGAPAHVNVHPGGRFLFAAMNRRLQVGVFPLSADGRAKEPSCLVQHEGRGPHAPNQNTAFPHSAFLDGSAKRLLCCDLGIDRIMVYDFDETSGQLTASDFPFAQVSSGAGPRHLAVHPSNRFVYVLNELDSTISAFAYDAESSSLSIVQTVSALPDGFRGESAAAQIMLAPSGRFLYASNRGHDSVVIFAVDSESGHLRLNGHEPSQGERPHNFTMNESGTLMLVANQRSGRVVSFHVDVNNGRLTPTGHSVEVQSPVCVVLRA